MTRKGVLKINPNDVAALVETHRTAQIAEQLRCSSRTILRVVKLFQLQMPPKRKKGAAELRDVKWLRLRESVGATAWDVAKELGCSASPVWRACKKFGVKLSSPEHARTRRYRLNDHFFDQIDSEVKAYFVGFIGADGCIERNWGMRLKIHKKDLDILVRLKREIKFSGPITPEGDFVSLRLYSIDLVKALARYGIVRRKSATLPFAKNIPDVFLPHYLRGIFDGDGSVGRQVRLVTGSRAFCDGFLSWFSATYGRPCYCRQEDNKWRIVLNRRDEDFVHFLYRDSSVGLLRKRKLYRCHWVES